MRKNILASIVLSAGMMLPLNVRAADWPGYRGENQDGISTESLELKLPGKQLWKVPTPNGFSSFAISKGKAFTLVLEGRQEVCAAYDASTGKGLWATRLGEVHYDGGGDTGAKDNKGGDGPRSTPACSDGKVYAFTADLVVYCLNAETGKVVWSHDIIKENAGRNIQWQNAASPVIDGDLVFVAGGGKGQSLIALDKKTGKVAWKAHDENITHSTPVVGEILGVKQVIYFCKSGLVAVAPADGKLLWKYPFKFATSTAISPVICGDIVYCSAGYGVGGSACKLSKEANRFVANEMWFIHGDKEVANHWSTPVYKDGYLYGMFSFKKWTTGPMKCVEVATGKIMWSKDGFGAGNAILVGDKVLGLSDSGELVSVAADPKEYKEISRAKVVSGKCWSTPAVADGKVYVRSTKEGVCLDVSGK